jgi:hypothetical protein
LKFLVEISQYTKKKDWYLIWILRTWLIILTFGIEEYGVGHKWQWTQDLKLRGNGEF